VTAAGTLVGTLPFMAPEQVEGREADARTDLWALGCLLYEMVSGQRAFAGETPGSLIGAILAKEPEPLASRQPLTPPGLERLVKRCLAKDPDARWDSAHDVADELRWMRETSAVGAPAGVRPRGRRALRTVLLVAAGLAVFASGAGVMWLLRPSPPVKSIVRSALLVDPAENLNAGGVYSPFLPTPGGSRTALTWTPDGQALVFVGRRAGVQQLYVRRLDADGARPLDRTDNAQVPAVSPDGQWVAFWADGVIRRVPLRGGPVVDLAPGISVPPWGLVWDAGGGLFFGRGLDGIWAIPAEGKPAAVTTVGEERLKHMLPSLLPGGRVLLYTVRKRSYSWGDEEVVAQPLPTGTRRVLLRDAVDARYVPATGHLVFMRRGVLYAVPFDPEHLELRGAQVPVLDPVAHALTSGHPDNLTGAGQFAIAPTGTLAWLSGPVVPYGRWRLITLDRRGQVTPLPAPAHSYGPYLRVSPDQRRLAVTARTLTEVGLLICDLERPAPFLPLTTEGEVGWPLWRPGGQELVFPWLKDGRWALATQAADGTAPPRALLSRRVQPASVRADGRMATWADGDSVLLTVESGKARVEPLFQTPQTVQSMEFSPDGHWLAYGSAVTGREEIYVRPYPGPGGAVPVSIDGGRSPAWHPTSGREIFFLSVPDPSGRRRMMAAAFTPGSPPAIGRPTELFGFDPADLLMACEGVRCFDVAADGQRFYTVQRVTPFPPPVVTHISLIQNWSEELKAKVPGGTR